ncbi:MAG: YybS family protein [Syntrophaceae bacterium]|nr:YybS family protein [Syntrophaceae bacterium]
MDLNNGMIQGGAILTFTFLLVALIPFAGPSVLILTPLPIIYYRSRLGRLRGMTVLAVSILVAYVVLTIVGHGASLSVLFMIGFTGVLLSEVLKWNFSVEKTILLTSMVLFCCSVGFVLYHAFRSGIAPWRMVETYVAGMIEDNLKLYAQMNISDEQVQMIRDNAPQITIFFTGIFPALSLSGIVITVWVNLLAGRRLFQRTGITFPNFGDLAAWKAPERLVWIVIIAGGMLFVPLEWFTVVGMNILIVSGLIYLFQGLAIAAFFFRQKQVPKIFRLLFYGLILVQQYMLIVLMGFGLFDMWVDFRKRIKENKDNIHNP